jgi:hypothetical protein
MDVLSVGGVTLLHAPQDMCSVHHGLSLIFTFTDYYICSGLTHKTMSVLHVFLVEEVCSYRFMIIAVFWVSNEGRPY